jgi:mannitol-1-phosphate 5-dehydrogenase
VKDDVARVGRQPIRKLSRDDRLVGPTLMAIEYGMPVKNLLVGIAAALLYDAQDDPQAKELQQKITDEGIEKTVLDLTGFKADGPEVKGVQEAYQRLKAARVN